MIVSNASTLIAMASNQIALAVAMASKIVLDSHGILWVSSTTVVESVTVFGLLSSSRHQWTSLGSLGVPRPFEGSDLCRSRRPARVVADEVPDGADAVGAVGTRQCQGNRRNRRFVAMRGETFRCEQTGQRCLSHMSGMGITGDL